LARLVEQNMKKTAIALIGFLLTMNLAAQNAAPAAPDFSAASAAINKAIAEKKLPGAVLLVGHNGKIVFHQAYGVRKYANEPGLDGKPSPAEPMTEDTIFDMASLTKCLATATAIMQLVEQGKVDVDAPVIKYLPDFAGTSNANSAVAPNANSAVAPNANSTLSTNASPATTLSANGATIYQPGAQPQVQAQNGGKRAEGPTYNKATVTVRELLTHYSGLPEDVSLKDPWGLAAPDKAEGIRRAMNAELKSVPGTKFVYSDVNFITLGAIVEKVSNEPLDVYAQQHIFTPLNMRHTRYLPIDRPCGLSSDFPPYSIPSGNRVTNQQGVALVECDRPGSWDPAQNVPQTAPTQHDNEGTPETNPNFDHLLRGTVHDPTTRRMGGVAGHAGVFSTAGDVAKFAQALLDKLLYNRGPFPLKQSTLKLMTTPEQPSTAQPGATIFTPDGKPTTGIAARGFGWDINTAFSRPRGEIFPIGSFGHTGFTGTALWIDPASDTYIVLLANSVHPRGASPISPLRGEVATDVAKALGLAEIAYQPKDCEGKPDGPPVTVEEAAARDHYCKTSGGTDCPGVRICSSDASVQLEPVKPLTNAITYPSTLTGIDVLESTNFATLKELAAKHGGHLRIGLLTNQTGVDSHGHRTIDILRSAGNGIELVALFSPEHGIFGAKDSEIIGQETDPTSGLKVTSLYGPKDSDKRPKPEDLKGLDAVVIDLQDAGVRFYTYETVVAYFIEASGCELSNPLQIVVLDRPALIGGEAVQGPISNTAPAYINYMPEPVRNGMTLGEIARYFRTEHPEICAATPDNVSVVKMQGWHRAEFYDQTGLPWINPSPNLRNVHAATLYPGLGMMDATNVSVGRGTSTPFEVFGAGSAPATKTAPSVPAWFDGKAMAAYLTARKIPGVTFAPTTFPVAETPEKYPYHGQTIEGVKLTATDRLALDSPELGIEILSALHHLYPTQFKLGKAEGYVANTETMEALRRGDDPRTIAASWAPALAAFKSRRTQYLLYP
jgi:uncharacterized protein YbbC (DUF1343 family)/CubicO group peptidase (beta-lactamase class C family)